MAIRRDDYESWIVDNWIKDDLNLTPVQFKSLFDLLEFGYRENIFEPEKLEKDFAAGIFYEFILKLEQCKLLLGNGNLLWKRSVNAIKF